MFYLAIIVVCSLPGSDYNGCFELKDNWGLVGDCQSKFFKMDLLHPQTIPISLQPIRQRRC